MPIRRVYFYFGLSVLIIAIGIGVTAILEVRRLDGTREPVIASVDNRGDRALPEAPPVRLGAPFVLIDQNGKQVASQDLKGRHILIFFGYTYCPDVCPTNLTAITHALDMLGETAKQVQPLFITVDPLRDTPEQLKLYLEHFHPSFLGLTGTRNQVDAVMRSYKIFSQKTEQDPDDPEDYLLDHSSITYLIGPDGNLDAFISNGETPENIARKILEAL